MQLNLKNKKYDIFGDDFSNNKFSLKAETPMVDYPESFGYRRKLVYMTPDEYMDKAYTSHGREKSGMPTIEKYIKHSIFPDNLKRIKEGLFQEEEVVPTPWLETKRGVIKQQEGRHRSVAAKQLGMEKIPVYMVETDKGYIREIEGDDVSENTINTIYLNKDEHYKSPAFTKRAVPNIMFINKLNYDKNSDDNIIDSVSSIIEHEEIHDTLANMQAKNEIPRESLATDKWDNISYAIKNDGVYKSKIITKKVEKDLDLLKVNKVNKLIKPIDLKHNESLLKDRLVTLNYGDNI
jgi:hypothetical protein